MEQILRVSVDLVLIFSKNSNKYGFIRVELSLTDLAHSQTKTNISDKIVRQ